MFFMKTRRFNNLPEEDIDAYYSSGGESTSSPDLYHRHHRYIIAIDVSQLDNVRLRLGACRPGTPGVKRLAIFNSSILILPTPRWIKV